MTNIDEEDKPTNKCYDGYKSWWKNNKRHRLTGPAVIYQNGETKWFICGTEYNAEDHPFNIFRKEYNLTKIYKEWPIEMKILFKLTYSGEK
jgi:hypothetical protein